jgi:hypothetical protein
MIKEGTYKIFDSSFFVDFLKVLIKKRKERSVTQNKTKYYLEGYYLDDKNKKQRVYISSLYPQFESNVYQFDYNRQLFSFVLNSDIEISSEVIIQKVG